MTPIAQLIAELREIAAEREFIHLMSWSVLQQKFEAAAEALARQEELLAEAGKVVELVAHGEADFPVGSMEWLGRTSTMAERWESASAAARLFGLPWSERFGRQIADKADRHEYVADQVSVRIALGVRALREDRGLSQAQLGEMAGTTQSAISLLENPDAGNPSVTTLLKVGAALDVPLSVSFLEWEDWFREGRLIKKSDLLRHKWKADQ